MATKIKIRKGDSVQVLAGKDAGKRGTVLRVLPDARRVVVEKVNMIKRHTKPRPAPRSSGSQQIIPGGVIEKEAALHISNVQLVCPSCGKPSRVGYRVNDDGTKVRVCRNCGKDVDG
ncbi:MAG TPA: 50S ribosomal protein L24 [Gaiellales bacterium]|jgi:large subunit ribosomal protein L24